MPRLSTGMRNSFLANVAEELGGGVLRFYSGAAPATTDAAPTGVVVATLEFHEDGFAAPNAGQMSKSSEPWEDPSADASGTIGYARFTHDDDAGGASTTARRIDFSVTATGGGGDIEVQNTVVEEGQPIVVTNFVLIQPAGSL